MVGCCNFGPCKKKKSYEFNNPGYAPNKSAGTYRQSQLLEEDGENSANGDVAKLDETAGDAVDGDAGIKGVVAVDLDSDSPSALGDSDSSPGKRNSKIGKDSKRSSKKSSSSRKGSMRDSKRSVKDRDPDEKAGEAVEINARSSSHDREGGERSSQVGEGAEAGAAWNSVETGTEQTTTYTTVIRHHIDGSEDAFGADEMRSNSDKRNSNVSSHSSSSHRVISSFDPTGEGHFHSEHQYQAELTPGRTSVTSEEDGGRYTTNGPGEESTTTTVVERSSIMVNVPSETEELDNITNNLVEDARNGEDDEEWTTVTEVTETVIHINSPVEIGDSHRYTSY